MIRELLSQLTPGVVTVGAAWVGGTGLVVGTVLWLAGSRFSQMLVTLAAVGVGAYLGKKVPGWVHSEIDPIGTCMGGALVLGIVGYVYHRMWVGAGLGLLLAGWAAVVTWNVVCPGQRWGWPAVPVMDLAAIGKAVWAALPVEAQRVMPWTVGLAGVVGMVLAEFWPRVAGRLFYSLLGLSVVGAGALLVKQTAGWPGRVPSGVAVQVAMVAGLVGVGMAVQGWLSPRRAGVAAGPAVDDAGETTQEK
jgi:hypothetical protein